MYLTFLASLGFVALAAAQDLINALQAQPDLSTLLAALQALPQNDASLTRFTSNFITILAPTDDAFAKIPPRSPLGHALANAEPGPVGALLAYHYVKGIYRSTEFMETPLYISTVISQVGEGLKGVPFTNVSEGQNVGLLLNGSDATILSGEMMSSIVTEADIEVGEIIIHKIDTVLTLPINASAQATEAGLTGIVDALAQVDLVETVDTTPDLTVFIPSNEAFEALGTGYEGLSTDEPTNILTYHVIAGNVLFSPELSNTTVPSLQGTDLTVTVLGDAVFINEAEVMIPNIIIANGVAHVINKVLNPDDIEVDVDSLSVSATNNATGGGDGNAMTGNPALPPTGAGNITPTANETGTGTRGRPNATATSMASAVYTGAATMMSAAGTWLPSGVIVAIMMFTM